MGRTPFSTSASAPGLTSDRRDHRPSARYGASAWHGGPELGPSRRVYPSGIVGAMTVSYALLGLLNEADRHGYDLKQSYDRRFGAARPLRFGQVYRTLAQLERDGLVAVVGVEHGAGPDRKRYSITADGVTDLERWLSEPEDPQPQLQTVLFTKVVVALLSGKPADAFLEAQRQRHFTVMRE